MLHKILEDEARMNNDKGGVGGSADWYWNYMNGGGAGTGDYNPYYRELGSSRYAIDASNGTFRDPQTGKTHKVEYDYIRGQYYYRNQTGSATFWNGGEIYVKPIWGSNVYLEDSEVSPFFNRRSTDNADWATADGNDPIYNGGTWALTGSFAFAGGLNFELGKVWDGQDNAKWYFTFGPSLGFDLSFGILQKNIYDSPNFSVDQYQNYSSSYDIGILVFDAVIVGGDNYEDRYQSRLGATYGENGWGISIGSPIGVTWNSGRTIVW